MKYLIIMILIGVLSCGINPPSKFDKAHPQYVKLKNIRSSINHINDTTLLVSVISQDAQYGYSEDNPIMIGMSDINEGAANRTKYLNALLSPNGKPVVYKRLKPCCPFSTPNYKNLSPNSNYGMLEKYELSYEGIQKPVILYLNLYDQGPIYTPKGFLMAAR